MYQGIFDTDFDKYTEDAVTLFGATGNSRSSRTSRNSHGEYPYVSADEKLKAAFSSMLDQMQ